MAVVESGKGLPDAATAAPFKVHNAFEEDGSHVPAAYRGMKLVDDEYERVSALGEGTYGTVFLARSKSDPTQHFALKRIRMENEKEGFPITAIREIKLLAFLGSQTNPQNVIKLHDVVRSKATKQNQFKPAIYMVFEYMDHDLTGLMERCNYNFKVTQLKCYMKQLLRGLYFIHSNGILHRDLKASNLLTNNKGELKIADFGLARNYDKEKWAKRSDPKNRVQYTVRVITLWYRPLELLINEAVYGPSVDIWSAGCIFAEMLCGKPLFPGKDDIEQIKRILEVLGKPSALEAPTLAALPGYRTLADVKGMGLREKLMRNCATEEHRKKITPKAVDLVSRMLCLDPDRRISARDAIMHEYFYEQPMACEPEELPKFAASHEMTMKAKRKADKEASRGQDHKRGRYDGGHHDNRQPYYGGGRPVPQGQRAPQPGPQGPYRGPATGAGPPKPYQGQRQPVHARADVRGVPRQGPAPPQPQRGYQPATGGYGSSYGSSARPGQGSGQPSTAPFSASGGYGAPSSGAPRYGVEHKGPYRGPGGGAPQGGDRRGDGRGAPGPHQKPQWESQRR